MSEVKSVNYIELEFGSQHPQQAAHNCLELCLQEVSNHLLASLGIPPNTHMCTYTNTDTRIIKRNLKRSFVNQCY